MKHLAILLAALGALLAAPLAAEPDFPPLTGRVVDAADIIPDDVETELTEKLEAFEQQTDAQMVVATVPSLQGNNIATFGYQLGRAWEIGDAERNDGVILLVAPNEREVRIEVGYGLEGVLTDAMSSIIIRNDILPQFRAGNMPAGIVAGTDEIIELLVLPEDQARAQVLELTTIERSERSSAPWWVLPLVMMAPFVFIVFLIWFGVTMSGGSGGTRYGGSGSSVRTYSSSSSSSWSSGSSFSSSSSSFSGGGGSFGGGGASGSW